jgi:hypothetical protein
MKKLTTFFAVLIIMTAMIMNVSAKKWRVNNVPGINANFSTLVAAYNGSSAGDTIYLEGTGIPYVPPDTIKKKLIIIGPGYFLSDNDSTQANKAPASIYIITFGRGSDGSVITGINITYIIYISDCSNITVQRNYIAQNVYFYNYRNNITNILIKQNFINGSIYQNSGTKAITNLFILNNYIQTVHLENVSTTPIIMNNVIYSNYYMYNAEYFNNINTYSGYVLAGGSNNNFYNNIFAAGGTDANGNKYGINMSNVFVGTPNSQDGQYRLKTGSPAKAAGYGGVDCGMFGNSQPYVLSGIPQVPHIFDAKVENAGSSGTGLPVRLKAKSLN